MIIGNNNPNPNNQNNLFEKRFNMVNEAAKNNHNKINPFQEDNQAKYYQDPTNKSQMADKAFAMLQQRYNDGLISLDEFNRKCRNLDKFRNKQ